LLDATFEGVKTFELISYFSILKLLIDSEDDCIHVASCNGLNSLGEVNY